MRKGKLNKVISGFAFAFALAFGMLLMTGTSVSAQSRDRDYRDNDRVYDQRDRDRDGDRDNQNWRGDRGMNDRAMRQAYQNGFQAGERQAMNDLRSRRGRGWNNNGYGNNGYGNYNGGNGNYGGFGRSGQMRQAYQNGFNAGYQQTMNRYRNNRGGRWPF